MQVKELSIMNRKVGESVSTKLKRNPGFSTFPSVCQVLNGDDVVPPEDIAPEKIPLLKYAPVTTCDVERSFPAYKHIRLDRRQSVTP
jgi:hypothetical protein